MGKRLNHDPIPYEPPQKKSSITKVPLNVNIKPGTVITDMLGKKWRLGKTIGTGGFGDIYLASDNINQDVKTDAEYVAKIESHTSGPLFVEIHCYLHIAKPDMISDWKKEKTVSHLGIPNYIASGSHSLGGNKYRFLIIPRFEKDLENSLEGKKNKFNLKTVLTIAYQTTDILQYVHNKGYIHSDVKASNILFNSTKNKPRAISGSPSTKTMIRYHGCTPVRSCKVRRLHAIRSLRPNMNLRCLRANVERTTKVEVVEKSPETTATDKIYLLDYGLASKYMTSDGKHKDFSKDARKAHAGTILFCSRDAHQGVQSRRSDLESLGYNMIYWLTTNLPWSENVEDPEIVYKIKQKCVNNLKEFLDFCFDEQCPRFLFDYFNYLRKLEFKEEPDYGYCKNLFRSAIGEYGYKDNLLLDFDNLEGWGRKQKKVKRNTENVKVQKAIQKFQRSPLKSNLPVKPTLRKHAGKKLQRQMKWSRILMDPEIIMKNGKSRERKTTECSDSGSGHGILNLDLNQLNPTTAMVEVFNRGIEKLNANGGVSPRYRGDVVLDNINGYTPAMMEVYNRKREREELEQQRWLMANSKSNGKSGKNKPTKGRQKKTATTSRTRSGQPQPQPNTRLLKSHTNVTLQKKEAALKNSKALQLKRTYSLRG